MFIRSHLGNLIVPLLKLAIDFNLRSQNSHDASLKAVCGPHIFMTSDLNASWRKLKIRR